MSDPIEVRLVTRDDLDALVHLERAVWKPIGAPALTRNELAAWFDEQSPYFLIAERRGEPCGYFFGRQLEFSFARLHVYLDPNNATEKGFSRQPHDPSGTSVYGINIISTLPGVGRALYHAVHTLLARNRVKYYIGFSRLAGFDRYCRQLEASTGAPIQNSDIVARWYAHANARRLGMRIWPECSSCPHMALPELVRPDPVLAFHVRGTSFGLAGIMPEYLNDPASRNYGAFIVSEYPHRS